MIFLLAHNCILSSFWPFEYLLAFSCLSYSGFLGNPKKKSEKKEGKRQLWHLYHETCQNSWNFWDTLQSHGNHQQNISIQSWITFSLFAFNLRSSIQFCVWFRTFFFSLAQQCLKKLRSSFWNSSNIEEKDKNTERNRDKLIWHFLPWISGLKNEKKNIEINGRLDNFWH